MEVAEYIHLEKEKTLWLPRQLDYGYLVRQKICQKVGKWLKQVKVGRDQVEKEADHAEEEEEADHAEEEADRAEEADHAEEKEEADVLV